MLLKLKAFVVFFFLCLFLVHFFSNPTLKCEYGKALMMIDFGGLRCIIHSNEKMLPKPLGSRDTATETSEVLVVSKPSGLLFWPFFWPSCARRTIRGRDSTQGERDMVERPKPSMILCFHPVKCIKRHNHAFKCLLVKLKKNISHWVKVL